MPEHQQGDYTEKIIEREVIDVRTSAERLYGTKNHLKERPSKEWKSCHRKTSLRR